MTTANTVSTRAQAAQPSLLEIGTEPSSPTLGGRVCDRVCSSCTARPCRPVRRGQRRPANLGVHSSTAPFRQSCSERCFRFRFRGVRWLVTAAEANAKRVGTASHVSGWQVVRCRAQRPWGGTSKHLCHCPALRNLPEEGPLLHLLPRSCRPLPSRPPAPRMARWPLRCVRTGPPSSSPCSPDFPSR